MARPMNLDKRIKALALIQDKAAGQSIRAKNIANELNKSFKSAKTPEGKKARATAKHALTIAARTALVAKRLPL